MAKEYNPPPPPHRHTRDCDTYTLSCGRTEHTHSSACNFRDDAGNKVVCSIPAHTHSGYGGGCYRHSFNCGH